MVNLLKLDYEFYRYNPSIAGAAIFVVLFVLVTGAHCYYAWRYKARFFIVFILGGLFEVIGHICRAISHNNIKAIGPYAIQNLFLLVAPALFAATIYMILGRIIRLLRAEEYSVIRVSRLTKTFVWCDVFCFVIQGNGGSIQAVGSTLTFTLGRWIVVGGLLLQITVFSFFVVVAAKFHKHINAKPTAASADPNVPWRKHLMVLYVTSALILLRNLVRAIEYFQGLHGWVITHEVMLYVFDAVPMLMVFVIMLVFHPCELLNEKRIRGLRSLDSENNMLELGISAESAAGQAFHHASKE